MYYRNIIDLVIGNGECMIAIQKKLQTYDILEENGNIIKKYNNHNVHCIAMHYSISNKAIRYIQFITFIIKKNTLILIEQAPLIKIP